MCCQNCCCRCDRCSACSSHNSPLDHRFDRRFDHHYYHDYDNPRPGLGLVGLLVLVLLIAL